MQIQREVYPPRPEVGLPSIVKESIPGDFVVADLANYFGEEVPRLVDILNRQNIYLAGGYVLKNFLKDRPGYKEEFWMESDIDFWAVNDDYQHDDPFCPLRKLLQERGYESRIVASGKRLFLLSADYKRLGKYVEKIQEWTLYDEAVNKLHTIQLILLKSYRNHLIYSRIEAKKYVRWTGNENNVDVINERANNSTEIYRNRTAEDFLIDAVLSFDLTCCQVAFYANSANPQGIVSWFGTTGDDANNPEIDYPNQTPIIQNVERYLTKIGSVAIRTQSLMEWLRTLKRSYKYARRGFRIVNWDVIGRIIAQNFLLTETYQVNEFIETWDRDIYLFRFFKYSRFIPIWFVDDAHNLYSFTFQNREPVLIGNNPDLNSNTGTDIISEFANVQPDRPLSRDFLIEVSGRTSYAVPILPQFYNDLLYGYEGRDIPIEAIEITFDKNYQFVDGEKIVLNEIQILETINPECYDIIGVEDRNNMDWLRGDEDNILIIKIDGNNYRIDCMSRTLLSQILADPTRGKVACNLFKADGTPIGDSPMMITDFVNPDMRYYRIDTSFGRHYISSDDINKMIHSPNQVFYIDTALATFIPRSASVDVFQNETAMLAGNRYNGGYLVSGDHCQEGTDISVDTIKVCGGAECLRLALGELGWLSEPI